MPPAEVPAALYTILPLVIPGFYDASGSLAIAWYDELREAVDPPIPFEPSLISQGNSEWIETELRALFDEAMRQVEADIEDVSARMIAEAEALTQKEVARGFRDTVDGNVRRDPIAIGWSRHTRPGACPFCRMLARDSAVYRTERSARFAAHTNCHCVARPEFEGGDHGPEADVYQYLASQRQRTPEERRKLREYLAKNYPAEGRPVTAGESRGSAPLPTRDVDAERTVQQLEDTLAALERSLARFESAATRARAEELREQIRARRG